MKLTKLDLGAIVAKGWLAKELELQKTGLTGNLPKLWYDVSDDSAWLGGKGEAWERGPYYLTGLISLAWTLKDEELQRQATKWVNSIIASQGEDGFFGPIRTKDWWSRTSALGALCSYHEATKDGRILPFLKKYFLYQFNNLESFPPYMWSAARAVEEFYALRYYYERTGDLSVFGLAKKLSEKAYDWFSVFRELPFTKPSAKYINRGVINLTRKIGAKSDAEKKYGDTPIKELSATAIRFRNRALKNIMLTHGVNVAMALKYPAYYNFFIPQEGLTDLPKKAYCDLMRHHGTALGIFTSDEHLDGVKPTKGIELCAVVELAYTAEKLIEYTADPFWGDVLEMLIFNALPATISDDFTAHQYVQQPNQIAASVVKRDFFDVDADGNTFGLAPNYGCCTANMHQGFPRYAEHICYKSNGGFAFFTYAPCLIYTEFDGKRIRFNMDTSYPFEDEVRLTVEDLELSVRAEMSFRVPNRSSIKLFCNGRAVGEGDNGLVTVNLNLIRGDVITVKISSKLYVENNPDGSVSLRRANLLFVPEIAVAERKLKGEEPFQDREYTTDGRWRDVPVFENGAPVILSSERKKVDRKLPFGRRNAPIKIMCESAFIENWGEKNGDAGTYPKEPKVAKGDSLVTLIPYGFSKLRIAQYPMTARPERSFISNETLNMMDEMEKDLYE